ncbi:MAG TPA: hypothetical protein VEA79_03575 [Phenylobacterium sp.]|nr:hypothetical protein [Phenylobacterium sp.]
MLPMLEDHREFDMAKAVHLPIGLASPLWWPFAAATSAGLTFWWMTRWMPAANLEALAEAFAPLHPPVPPEPAVVILEEAAEQVQAATQVPAEATEAAVEEAAAVAEVSADPAPEADPAAPKRKSKAAPEAPLH